MSTRARSTSSKKTASETSFRQFEQRLDRLEQMLERVTDTIERVDHGTYADPGHEDLAQAACSLPSVPERTFDPHVSSDRAELIRYVDKKWVNGTTLTYYFFTRDGLAGHPNNVEMVRQGFKVWEDVGIGINFEEVDDIRNATVRIGFKRGDGAWSYVGRDVRDIPGRNERTMNFGWDLRHDRRGVDTAVHEIGHTLGFPHEHQNPYSGIVWDDEAVYRYFEGSPNYWSREKTYHNVLRKLSRRDVEGSEWDPDSIMHYAFDQGLILEPSRYRSGLSPAPGLSETDKAEVRKLYPKATAHERISMEPLKSVELDVAPAEQQNFVIEPDGTRKYRIRAFGESDLLMVLFRLDGDSEQFIAGSDDSGTEDNAEMTVRLEAGEEYILRVRLFSQYGDGGTAIMYW